MLNKCAQGYVWTEADHKIKVRYNGKCFYRLPTGSKSSRRHLIEAGYVVDLVQHLGISEKCATEHLPLLKNLWPEPPSVPA